MTIETLLESIQNFRSLIDQWGVTAETLIAVAFLAIVMFIFSFREVAGWFLRVHTLRDEVKGLRQDIAELKSMMSANKPLDFEEEAPSKKKEPEKSSKSFRLDH
jgi:hypothetical protein